LDIPLQRKFGLGSEAELAVVGGLLYGIGDVRLDPLEAFMSIRGR
jgi:hypothetical protein